MNKWCLVILVLVPLDSFQEWLLLKVNVERGGVLLLARHDVDAPSPALVLHKLGLLQLVYRAIPALAGHHRRVDEADRKGEDDPGRNSNQQQPLACLEPKPIVSYIVLTRDAFLTCRTFCARRAWPGTR